MSTNGSEPAVEVKAREMGWKPLDEFKGNPDHWRDAEEYVQRGEEVLPILRAESGKLRSELAAVRAEAAETKSLFEASQEAIMELKKFHTEDTKRQVDKAKRDLKAGIKAAKAEGNEDLEEELREELTTLNTAAAAPPPPAPVVVQPKVDPDFISWRAENTDWFEIDDNKTALMFAAAQRIRNDPANVNLKGKAFYNAAAAEAERVLNGGRSRPTKMEGGEGGRGGGGGDGGGPSRSYSDLPADAKAACNRQGTKLVGEGRAFKTETAWRKHYVEQYFLGE